MPSFGIELCLRIGKIELFIGIISAVRGRRKRMRREGACLRLAGRAGAETGERRDV